MTIYYLNGGSVAASECVQTWLPGVLLVQELEQEVRGAVSGVQTGLQSAMDLAKFGLVIALPHPDKFGFLVILSFVVSNHQPSRGVSALGYFGQLLKNMDKKI